MAVIWKVGQACADATDILSVVGGVVVGYVLTDLISGLFHWGLDRFGTPQTPVIGGLIYVFRRHHEAPQEILEGRFVQTNDKTALASVIPLVGAFLLPGVFVPSLLVTLVLGIWMTNEVHKWAHNPNPGRVVRVLQRWRIVLTPEQHQRHHTEPFQSHYCITTGWWNPLLEKIRFFSRLERSLGRLG